MAQSIDRRAFLKGASTTAAVLAGAPLLAASRAGGADDRLVVAVGQWGIETPFAWRSSQSEKTLWDCMYDPLIMRDPKTFEYRPGAGDGMEALERAENVDVQAALGRAVPRRLRRDDRRRRQVHRRAESQARLAGRIRAVLPHAPRPHRDARQVHGRDALQEPGVGGAVELHAVRRLPEHHVEEVHRVGRARTRRPCTRSAPGPSGTSRASRATTTASRRCPTTGARRRPSRSWSSGGSPIPRRAWPGCARARSTSATCSATTWTRRRRPGLRIHETPNAACSLGGPAGPDDAGPRGLLPDVPVGRRSEGPEEPGERAQGAAGAEPGRQQEDDRQRALEGHGLGDAVLVLVLPVPQGLQQGLEGPALRSRARQEAPGRGRSRRRLRGPRESPGHDLRARRAGHDGGGRARLGEDRHQGPARARGLQQLPAQEPRAQDEQDALGLRLAALRRARPGLAALHLLEGRLQSALADGPYDEESTRSRGSSTPRSAPG